MKSNPRPEASLLKQEIVIALKKLLQGHKSLIDNQLKQLIDGLRAYLERGDSEFSIEEFYTNHFDLFKQCLAKHDRKLDLMIFEFFEKIQRHNVVELDRGIKRNIGTLTTLPTSQTPTANDQSTKQADCLVSEFCRMFEYKDYKLTQRLIQFIHRFVTLSGNEISPLSLNKIVCGYLITYFEAKNSHGNVKLVDYIDVCLVNMIKFLVEDLELHTRLLKGRTRPEKTRTIPYIKNNTTFCSLIVDSIVEDAILTATNANYAHKRPFKDSVSSSLELGTYKNSVGKPNGRYGWCILCKNPANFYSLDQKVPVCTVDCKILLTELVSPSSQYKDSKLLLIQVMLKYFVKLSSKRNENINLDFKAYVLSKILLLYKSSGAVFICDSRTISRTNDLLANELIHNFCFSDGKVFHISIQILTEIIKKYRKTFKKEIKVTIKHVILNLLRQKDVKIESKADILSCINSLIFDVKVFTYFYLNFDLSVYEDFSIQELIGFFIKNIQSNPAVSSLSPVLVSQCTETVSKLINKVLNCLKLHKNKAFIDSYLSSLSGPGKSQSLEKFISKDLLDSINRQRCNIDQLSTLVTNFNIKHTSIVKNLDALNFYLPEIKDPAEKLAFLFYHNPQVSRSKLGHFFGEPDDIYLRTMTYFFDYEDYKGMRVDEAMSSFMNLFDLPGESQKIDRVLQKFSAKYSKDNSQIISEKCTYGLSFLVMMLQSEWHNPQVIEKMTYEQFMKLGMNIEEYEKYLTESLMKGIYETLTKKTLGSPDYCRGFNGVSPTKYIEMNGFKHLHKKSKLKESEIAVTSKNEYDYVFLEYFRKDLADALIVSLSMSYESTKNDHDCSVLSKTMAYLFDIFIIYNNKPSLEQLLLAITRLTALDKLGRPLEKKNVIILSTLLDLIKNNCDNLTSNCLKVWFMILTNARFYTFEPTPYESVLKKNNYLILTDHQIDVKLESFIFQFLDHSQNQLKIYQAVSLLFEIINGLLGDKELEGVNKYLLSKLYDYFKHAFGKKKEISTSQSFYNVIISNSLNTISNLNSMPVSSRGSIEDISDNLVTFIVSDLGEIVKLFVNVSTEETNVFKPYEMLLSNLYSMLIR